MIKKEPWMVVGNSVIAEGQKGVITGCGGTTKNKIDYVERIDVRIEGDHFSYPYHPDDVKELKNKNNI